MNFLRQPISSKHLMYSEIVSLAVVVVIIVASIHLECASVTIRNILPKNGACKVNMDSLLGMGRPGPWVKISRRLFVFNTLTSHTVMNYRFNFFINPWPPNMKTSQRFHSDNTWVPSM